MEDAVLAAPPERPLPRARSITSNAVFSLINQIVGAVFSGGLTIFLARRLGDHGYGTYALAVSIAGLVLLPSDFGSSNSIARFVADYAADRPRVRAVVADGLRLKLLAAVGVSTALFLLAPTIAGWYHAPGLTWPIRGLSIAVLGQSVMLLGAIFTAIGQTRLTVITAFGESSVQVAVTIALVLAGAGATGAAFGQAVGYVAGGVLTLVLLTAALGGTILPRGLRAGRDAKRVAGYAGVLLIVDGAYTAFSYIDVLVIGSFLGTAAVGLFSAPIQMITFLGYPGGAVAAGVAPRLSRGARGGPNGEALLSGLRLLLIVQSLFTGFVLGWAPLMVRIALGAGYAGAVPVLRALSPYVFLIGFGSLVSLSANFLGEARRRVPVALATMGLNIGADLLLVPRLGPVGGAWGTDAAYALYAPAHLWICQDALGLDLRGTALTLARTVIAGALLTVTLLLFGHSIAGSQHILLTAAGGAAAILIYVAALLVLGEVRPVEITALLNRRRARPVTR